MKQLSKSIYIEAHLFAYVKIQIENCISIKQNIQLVLRRCEVMNFIRRKLMNLNLFI